MQGILPLFAILIIFALKSDARCSLRCTREEIATNTPHCTLYDVVQGTVCGISASQSLLQRLIKVYLTVDLVNEERNIDIEIHNLLGPNKLEIVFNRIHRYIESFTLYSDWIRISADAFRYMPSLQSLVLSSTALNSFPLFTSFNPYLTDLILHNFTLDNNLRNLPRGHVSSLSALESLRIYPLV